ncbi:type II toxin-antitoxin system PemK/MazF family toxin [Weissella confusa]|uniref:type II toxin-antitoxin system PemK/MazF family toxin n=1 Tax=Weissella confusa TaxID=1583 RepID=UPI00058788CC|nr:type II toxin-antitoxin system PemK/MazF family toxin [Weissella confusa]
MSRSKKVRNLETWAHSKIRMQESYESRMIRQDRKKIEKGGIYRVNLGFNLGHEIDKRRPALIISNQEYNDSPNGMATVIPLTKDVVVMEDGIPKYSFHYILRKEEFSFLEFDSTLEIDQIRSVSRRRIDASEIIGKISDETLQNIQTKILNFLS